MSPQFDLERFVAAQEPVYGAVVAELGAGRKRTHWIWFIFPQLRELGRSATAQRFGISGVEEARAYLAHPVLGPRLRECARLVTAIEDAPIEEILGWPDCLKLRSSMTLFARASGPAADFVAVLERYYGGAEDPATAALLG